MPNLFVDAIRECPEKMVHCKTVDEAIYFLEQGKVGAISFCDRVGQGQKTGNQLAEWIRDTVKQNKIKLPMWQIHSARYYNRDEIVATMIEAARYYQANLVAAGLPEHDIWDEWSPCELRIEICGFLDQAQRETTLNELKQWLDKHQWGSFKMASSITSAVDGGSKLDVAIVEKNFEAIELTKIEDYLKQLEDQNLIGKVKIPYFPIFPCIADKRSTCQA